MILLIDNYDSFTYNLYQYLGELGESILVKRNDELSIDEIEKWNPKAIVISPGPKRPEQAGVCVDVIKHFYQKLPILGICLGHQAIGYSFGATIKKADRIMHGKVSKVSHSKKSIFHSLLEDLEVMRYHSLVIQKDSLPNEFDVLARSMDDDEIMAIKHKEFPLFGLQFHPESIGTGDGKTIISNFLSEIRKDVLI